MSGDVAELERRITSVPDGWTTRQLGQVARIVTGKTPSTKDDRFWNGEVPFVTPSDIGDSPWCDTVDRHLSTLGAATVTTAPAGAVLFTCIASIGKSCILSTTSAFNQQINACIPGPSVDSYFLFSQLQAMCEEIRHLAGTTAVPIINKTTFSAIPICLPPLDEQQRIAEVLRSVDEAIAAALEVEAGARRVYRNVASHLLGSPSEKLPDGWREVLLSDCLADFRNGWTYDTRASNGTLPITRIETISKGVIDYDRIGLAQVDPRIEAFKITRNDILFSHINSVEHIAKVAIKEDDRLLYHGMNLMRLRPNETIVAGFLLARLQSDETRAYFRSVCKRAVNQASLNKAEIGSYRFNLPPLAEQQHISEVLRSANAAVVGGALAIQKLRKTKADLMSDLLSGRVRVTA